MGIFSQDKTSTNQTAYNQQIGVNTGNTGGGLTTGGAGSITAGSGSVAAGAGSIISLDATALNRAAQTVDNALAANTAIAQQSLQSFQGSNTANSEQGGLSPPTITPGSNNPFNLPSIGGYQIHITDFLWVGIAVVGLVLVVGYMRHRKKL